MLIAAALPLAAGAQDGPDGFAVVEKGPHHRVWQKRVTEGDAAGGQRTVVHSYTELATGLHYWSEEDGGEWLESREQFELVAGRRWRGKASFRSFCWPTLPRPTRWICWRGRRVW